MKGLITLQKKCSLYLAFFILLHVSFTCWAATADTGSAQAELKRMNMNLTYEEFFNQVRKGNLKTVRLFLDSGFNVNYENVNYENKRLESPLKIAAKKGHSNVIKLLLSRGAYVNTGDYTPLMIATDEGKVEAVEVIIGYSKDIDINDTGIDNETALHHACRSRQYKIAEILINAGANLEWPDDHGITPLICAVQEKDIKMAQLLIKNGADVNGSDLREGYSGQTPLMHAASYGNIDIVDLLLKNGAEINIKNKYGETALDYAIRKKAKEMITFLEGAGAKKGTAQGN